MTKCVTFAREGRSSVVPEWAGMLLQMVGYLHAGRRRGRNRRQRRRGSCVRLLHDAHRDPERDHLLAASCGRSAALTRKYARNLADITVRQNIQLHWLTIESLPEVVDALDAIGLSPKGACGDVVRNVTGCPLAGVDHDEFIDASPIALEIAQLLTANPEFLQSAAQVQDFRARAAPPGAPIPRSMTSR